MQQLLYRQDLGFYRGRRGAALGNALFHAGKQIDILIEVLFKKLAVFFVSGQRQILKHRVLADGGYSRRY